MSTNKRYDQEEEDLVENSGDDLGEWRRGPLLGKGRYGSVHMAAPTEPRAPRFRNFPAFMAVKSSHGSSQEELENERSLLLKLSDCPHVIRCLGDEETTDEDGLVSLHVFLEYASGGTLARLIGTASPAVDERLLRRHTRSVLQGLKRIHDEGYVHCDLKPENVLLVANGGGDESEFGFTAKVADLGMAKRAQSERGNNRLCLKGTMIYLPPEAAKLYVQEQASDVWALGCIVLKMFGGTLPWEGGKIGKSEVRRKIAFERPVLPAGLSEEAKDFLQMCLLPNPGDRATAEELLRHPFVHEEEVHNNRPFSFLLVDSDRSCSFKPKVLGENEAISDEKKEETGTGSSSSSSYETTLQAFRSKSVSQVQKIFRRLFSH